MVSLDTAKNDQRVLISDASYNRVRVGLSSKWLEDYPLTMTVGTRSQNVVMHTRHSILVSDDSGQISEQKVMASGDISIKFVVSNGNSRLLLLSNNELIISSDEDKTWNTIQLPDELKKYQFGDHVLNTIAMSGNLIIMTVAKTHILLRSTDAGLNWEEVVSNIQFGDSNWNPRENYCFTDERIVGIFEMSTKDDPELIYGAYYSIDTGNNWFRFGDDTLLYKTYAVTYCKGTWLLGGSISTTSSSSPLIMSIDDGATWTEVSLSQSESITTSINALNSFGTTVVAGGGHHLFFSKDCGQYWNRVVSRHDFTMVTSIDITGDGLWIILSNGMNWYRNTVIENSDTIFGNDSNRHLHEQVTFLTGEQYKTIELKRPIRPSDHYGIAKTYISGTHPIMIHAQFQD